MLSVFLLHVNLFLFVVVEPVGLWCAWHGHWIGGESPSWGELDQPRVESSCTQGSRRETPDSGAVRPCGEEAVNELQHRTRVNFRASRYGRVSVSPNAKPKIQPRP